MKRNKTEDSNSVAQIEESASNPVLAPSRVNFEEEFPDTISEPGFDFIKNPFKLKRRFSKPLRRMSRSIQEYDLHDLSRANLLMKEAVEAADDFERPVALSARLSKITSYRDYLRNLSISGESDQPFAISFEDVAAAAYRIRKGVVKSPCEKTTIPELEDIDLYFKKEFCHATGSFKERGARNTLLLLTNEQKQKGVIAASAGNHALALAYHGKSLNIPVTVVMPENCTIVKEMKCRNYGAKVWQKGYDLAEAKEFAIKLAREEGMMYVNGYDHPHILAGQGTIGLEILEQIENVDAIIVPVGGGGLIAGIAVAIKSLYPHCQVIGVESEMCPSFKAALDADRPVKIDAHHALTLADGLCVPKVGKNAFEIAKNFVDKTVVVSEDYIGIAVLRLMEYEKAIVEGSGAAGLAALLAGLLPELKGKRVVVPLCGGNIDPTMLGRCIERGMSSDGRLIRFIVNVKDRPGGIAELTQLVASIGVSIKDLYHERAWMTSGIFSVQIKIIAEVRNREHGLDLRRLLTNHYQEDIVWNTDRSATYMHSI
ncbi:L-threonine dehydratase catabolic TdcB-like [Xenia sp. Carnegie-2017]|uniref:L-threonine dehydratase catabolic TdcB-like n=1 Tax=Xenia sp. Carnegie-2017 TaxID=2897299 RepID=UPI001F04EE8D|nr:L-threonine dehydratase catabolic TdcB-like [Xenia sp. Carnegie-2017]